MSAEIAPRVLDKVGERPHVLIKALDARVCTQSPLSELRSSGKTIRESQETVASSGNLKGIHTRERMRRPAAPRDRSKVSSVTWTPFW